MAIQSSFKNMTLCLFSVCLICSALLAVVYAVTAEPIEAAAQAKTNNSIAAVVPSFDGTPEKAEIEVGGKKYNYYAVSKDGHPVGYAIESSAVGFSGPVVIMVGITADGVIYNTSVLSQSETPGLGAKCVEPDFADQFKNLDPAVKVLKVEKDGGDIEAITASTITSRAYCAAVETAMNVYRSIVAKPDAAAVPEAATAQEASPASPEGESNQ